ncbi:MAG: acyl-CoA thioester hydrolase/BAAT C-terminal domain-containing protein [Hyphomicrobiales bacterium]
MDLNTYTEIEPKVHVSPSSYILAGQPFSIKISKWETNTRFKLHYIKKEDSDLLWYSVNEYKTNEAGDFNIKEDAPISGTYKVADELGIFWSAERHSTYDHIDLIEIYNIIDALHRNDIALILEFNGKIIWKKTFDYKHILNQENKEIVRFDNLIANLYFPDNRTMDKVVVFIGGTEAGINYSDYLARIIGLNICPAISTAYFGSHNLPKELVNLPLEYFIKIIDYIKSNPKIKDHKIIMAGYSKGAEASLLTAIACNLIDALVLWSPSSYVFQGISITNENSSTWTWNKIPLNYIPLDYKKLSYGNTLRSIYEEGIANCSNIKECRIPVDELNCPILMFSGQDDLLWPSDHMANQIEQILTENNQDKTYNISFPKTGHLCCGTGYEEYESYFKHSSLPLGGTPYSSSMAARHSWEIFINFIKTI